MRKSMLHTTAVPDSAHRIVVTFHATKVLVIDLDGTIHLNNGGWVTPTTKERMNRFLELSGSKWRVGQTRFKWDAYNSETGERLPFDDNRTLTISGNRW